MSITLNAKGTSVPFFTIGKSGTTLYQGSTDPSGTYTIKDGDYWLNGSDNSLNVWGTSQWNAPQLADLHFVDSSIVAPDDTDLTLQTNGVNTKIVFAGDVGPGIITASASQDLYIDPTLGGGGNLILIDNQWPAADGTNGQVLTTNGSGILSFHTPTTGTVTSVAVSGGSTGLTTSGGPITTSGTITLSGTLAIANGGTGQTTASNAINALVPTQTSKKGRYLSTSGTSVNWETFSNNSIYGSITNWTAALARGSTNPARFAFIGDSNVMGQGTSTGTAGLTGAQLTAMGRVLANTRGYRIDNAFCEQNVSAQSVALNTYDTRFTVTSPWTFDTVIASFGGRFMRQPTTANTTAALTFAPANTFSKYRVWYAVPASTNTVFKIALDGTVIDTITTGSIPAAYTSKDYTTTLGSHTIGIINGGTGTTFWAGFETFDGTSTVQFLQGGISGALSSDLATTTFPWSELSAAVALAPDFCALYCTINDANNSIAGNTYYTNIEAIVKALQPTCDGVICVGFPANITGVTSGLYETYTQILKNIAMDYGWGFYDFRTVWGHSFVKANTAGYAYDGLHPNSTGVTPAVAGFSAYLTANGL